MTPTAHLDKLGATIRRMAQRTPSVNYSFGDLWKEDAAVRAKLRKLDTVAHMMRTPCDNVSLRFADGSVGTGATIWEALG